MHVLQDWRHPCAETFVALSSRFKSCPASPIKPYQTLLFEFSIKLCFFKFSSGALYIYDCWICSGTSSICFFKESN